MRNIFNSIRVKLFFRICLVIIIIMTFLVIINSVVLETFSYYYKTNEIKEIFSIVNSNYANLDFNEYSKKLDYLALEKNIDVLILKENELVYKSSENFINSFSETENLNYEVKYSIFNKSNILYSDKNITIRKTNDKFNGVPFILAISELNNNNLLYIRVPIVSINESVTISNDFLIIICIIAIIIAGIFVLGITKIFTKPIMDLKSITNKMTKLDFSEKYVDTSHNDEFDDLGKNINYLSETLEKTINQLKKNNMQLERDIEEKSKIDEMRKQFISDVSHELKTPISLIQGYAEGLLENVANDEESKKFYSSIILDEANKMDKLVKRLLELIKLEYEEINFNDKKFDIVEMIKVVIRNSKVLTDEKNIDVIFNEECPIYVYADDFYIEQVITNYYTNAIKNINEINGKKQIIINLNKQEKLRVSVFNTGNNIEEENLSRIWNRFYKVDKSRNRDDGGTGIGLALVKAIISKYNNYYGVENKDNGVEFYFDIDYSN